MAAAIFASPRGEDRIARASAWLVAGGRQRETLVVGATALAARTLVRQVTVTCGASFGWRPTTLGGLAVALATPRLVRDQRAAAGAAIVEGLTVRALHRLRAAGGLGRLEVIADWPGLAAAVARTLAEVRLAGLTAGQLEANAPELARVLGELEVLLEEEKLADRAALLRMAAEACAQHGEASGAAAAGAGAAWGTGAGAGPGVGAGPRSGTASRPGAGEAAPALLLLDVPVWTALEAHFIERLAAAAPDILATVPAGDGRTLARLRAHLPEAAVAPPPEPRAGALGRLQASLFSEGMNTPAERGDEVVFMSAPGESRECVEIARRIVREAEAGVPFDQMAVLLRGPAQYRAHLQEALRRARVPVHFSSGAVQPDPAGRAFLALLACLEEGLSARRFAEYLSLGETPAATAENQPPAALPATDRWVPPDEELLPAALADREDDGDPGATDAWLEAVPEGFPDAVAGRPIAARAASLTDTAAPPAATPEETPAPPSVTDGRVALDAEGLTADGANREEPADAPPVSPVAGEQLEFAVFAKAVARTRKAAPARGAPTAPVAVAVDATVEAPPTVAAVRADATVVAGSPPTGTATTPTGAAAYGETPALVAATPESVAQAATGESPLAPAEAPGAAVVGGTLRAPHRWEQILVDAAVIGGRARWERRLAGWREELKLRLGEVVGDEPRVEAVTRELGQLEALRAFALPILDDLEGLPTEAAWGEWLDRLAALATRTLRWPERVLAVLAELAPMAPVGPVGLREVRVVLGRRLANLTLSPSSRSAGRVFVGPVATARGLAFEVVFVPGLAERMFPQRVGQDPLLRDEVRVALGRARAEESRVDRAGGRSGAPSVDRVAEVERPPGVDRAVDRAGAPGADLADGRAGAPGVDLVADLATLDDRIEAERLALRIAVGSARRRVVLSYSRVDAEQARPRVPSFYGLEVLRAVEGRLPSFEALARSADRGGATRLGWPAPEDPADAIDEAEHDLALLARLVRPDAAVVTGAARYLITSNPHLARALRHRAMRWDPSRWTYADGLVKPDEAARVALAAHALAARSYSPTALQGYAACPYRFVLHAIHKLAPREEPLAIEKLDPLDRGSLVHEILFQLLSELRTRDLHPIRAGNLAEVRLALERILVAVAAQYKDRLAPAIDRVWEDGVATIRADLIEWLRRESEREPWSPWKLELAFGLAGTRGRDPSSTSEPVTLDCGIKLRGSIDLVETSADGRLRATDHKTGKPRQKPDSVVGGGESLQPVFYALALEKLFPERPIDGGRLSYGTSAGEFKEVLVALDRRARAAAEHVAAALGEGIDRGFLPAAPNKDACRFCDYRPVCGPWEEERTRRKKDRGDLHLLKTLRNLP